jgi:hypothetical protein
VAIDGTLAQPDPALVLGMASFWIRALPPEERLLASTRLTHPALRRMARAWSTPEGPASEGPPVPAP